MSQPQSSQPDADRAALPRSRAAELLHAAFEQTDVALALLGADGALIWGSDGLRTLLGEGQPPLVALPVRQLLHPDCASGIAGDFDDAIANRARFEGRLLVARRPASGDRDARESCWVQARLRPLAGLEPGQFLLLLSDVSDQVAREALGESRRRSSEMLTRLVHMLEQPVTLVERLDDVLRLVTSLSEVTGATRKGIFFTRIAGTAQLRATVSVGLVQTQVDRLVRFAELDRPLPRRRPEPREVQTLFDVDALADPLGTLSRDPTVHGLTIVPCFSGDELMGLLYLFTTPMHSPELHVQEMLWALGESCALAIAKDLVREEWQNARHASADSERLKAQFLANVTHELRTPLNGILGISSLLEQTELDAEQKELVETVRRSGQTLLRIVEQILDFGRIQSQGLSLERGPFELLSVLDDAIRIVRPQAEAKGLVLEQHHAPELAGLRLLGDAGRLQQILVNLLGNAVKFTDQGRIALEVRGLIARGRDRARLEFCVEDTGVGIPEERQEEIFDSFMQLDGSSSRRAGGTGLGLAICRELVQLMDGEIWVESRPGEGSRFSFEISTELAGH